MGTKQGHGRASKTWNASEMGMADTACARHGAAASRADLEIEERCELSTLVIPTQHEE